MKNSITLFIFVLFYLVAINDCHAQSFYVWDVDTSAYPQIQAKIYVYGTDYKQITDFSASDFEVTEDGVKKAVMSIDCSSHQTLRPVSSVVVIDRSSTMCGQALDIAKSAAIAWVTAMNLNNSEYAITTFDYQNELLQDFTNDKSKLFSEVYPLECQGSCNYDAAFLDSTAGSLLIAKEGIHSRNILMISAGDTSWFNNPHTDSIIKVARANNIKINFIIIGNAAPYLIKQISSQTGGQYFEYVNTENDAISICYKILNTIQGLNPCILSWWSQKPNCQQRYIPVNIKLLSTGTYNSTYYTTPYASIEYLIFDLPSVEFKYNPLAIEVDTSITVTAVNADFNIKNIEFDNKQFDINPKKFLLNQGHSQKLTISLQAINSNKDSCKFIFMDDLCPTAYMAYKEFIDDGYAHKKLRITYPDSGGVFGIGERININWDGLRPTDSVKVEFSSDSGATWTVLSEKAINLSYDWNKILGPPSNKCLLRVRQFADVDTSFYRMKSSMKLNDTLTGDVQYSDELNYLLSGTISKKPFSDSLLYKIKRWSLNDGQEIPFTTPVPDTGNKAKIDCVTNAISNLILCGLDDGTINLWFVGDPGLFPPPPPWPLLESFNGIGSIKSIRWNLLNVPPYNLRVILTRSFGTIEMWNFDYMLSKDSCYVKYKILPNGVLVCYDISSDTTKIVAAYNRSTEYVITIYNIETGEQINNIFGQKAQINCISFNPLSTAIAIGSNDGTVTVLDLKTGNLVYSYKYYEESSATPDTILSVAWKPDGSKIISGSKFDSIRLISALQGDSLAFIKGQPGPVTSLKWSPDGNSFASGSADGTFRTWQLLNNKPNQQAVTDTTFSIVYPEITALDTIDMGKWLITETKDSLITNFIYNSGIVKCRIDSIYFEGTDASQFEVKCGIPVYTIKPEDIAQICIAFTPNSVGIKKAALKIITQFDTITKYIQGEGIRSGLKVISKLIDFGDVPQFQTKDTTVNAVIQNFGTDTIFVDITTQMGPDLTHFVIDSGGGSFSIAPDSVRAMKLLFKPTILGSYWGTFYFGYNSILSPAIVKLYGNGVMIPVGSATLVVDTVKGISGDIIEVSIHLKNPVKIYEAGITGISANLNYNASLLMPLDEPKGIVGQGIRTIPLNMPLEGLASDELIRIRFEACLGNDTVTPLTLTNRSPIGGRATISSIDGQFTLLGICKEGGARLINMDGTLSLDCKPNPSAGNVQFDFETIEDGYTELYISDMLSNKILKVFSSGVHGKYSIEADLSLFYSGVYIYTLQAPNARMSKLILINN